MKTGIGTTIVMLCVGIGILIASCKGRSQHTTVDAHPTDTVGLYQHLPKQLVHEKVIQDEWKQYLEDQRTTMEVLIIVVVPINLILFVDLLVRLYTGYKRRQLKILRSNTDSSTNL